MIDRYLNFRQKNPVQYWTRILCLAYLVLTFLIWTYVDVEGCQSSTYTDLYFVHEDHESFGLGYHMQRTVNGTLWIFYQNFESGVCTLYGSYSLDQGQSWTEVEIETDGDFGEYSEIEAVQDTWTTSNGSVGVTARVNSYARAGLDGIYFWVNYNGTPATEWQRVTIYDDGTQNVHRGPKCVINDTDYIFFVYSLDNTGASNCVNNKIYDFPNSNWIGGFSNSGKYVITGLNAQVNQSGDFFYSFEENPGSGEILAIYEADNTLYTTVSTGTDVPKEACIFSDDRFVTLYMDNADKLYYKYETNPYSKTWTTVTIDSGTDWNSHLKFSFDQTDNITIHAYDNNVDTAYYWREEPTASHASWQSSKRSIGGNNESSYKLYTWGHVDFFPTYTIPGTSDIVSCLPIEGFWLGCKDEDGANNQDVAVFIHEDTTFYPGKWWEAPYITTSSLTDGTAGFYYTFTFQASGGTPPYSWSIVTFPGWLSLGTANATIYGLPPQVGTYSITIKVTDDNGLSDTESYNLRILDYEPEPEGEGWHIDFDPLLGALWWLFIATCTFIAILTTILEYMADRKRGRK